MSLVLFIVFGFIIGLMARAVMPGDQKLGIPMTIGLGVAGSFVGGALVSMVTSHRVSEFHTAGIIGSVLGALVLLLIGGGLFGRRTQA